MNSTRSVTHGSASSDPTHEIKGHKFQKQKEKTWNIWM